MINHIFFEGIVVNTWKFGSDLFARLASYRDPGQPLKRINETRDEPDYINARFTNAAMQGIPLQKGYLLRVEGLLQSREYQENLSEFLGKAKKITEFLPTISLEPLEQRQIRCGRSTSEILVEKYVILPTRPARQTKTVSSNEHLTEISISQVGEEQPI